MSEDREVRAASALKFVLGTFDPQKAPRMAPLAKAIFDSLRDGPLAWATVVDIGDRASDVQIKSIGSWIRSACTAGILIKTGEYRAYFDKKLRRRVFIHDTRKVELGPNASKVTW